MQRSCEICGERFPVGKNSTARYCLGCRREVQRARRQAEYESITGQGVPARTRRCVTCGGLFQPRVPAQKQCDTCRTISQTHIRPHKPDKPMRGRRETGQEAAARLSYEAREKGLSYGQYVAKEERGAV